MALPRPRTFPAACLLFLSLLAGVQPALADSCEDVIKMDGLFTKARTECRFSYYAWRFQQDSQVCMDKKGRGLSKELFMKGQRTFDSKAGEMGKDALCQKLLRDFPMTVKR